MANPIDDTGRNLAQWLREVARGPRAVAAPRPRAEPQPETSEAVLEHLESRIGQKLRSRDAVDRFLEDLASMNSNAQKRGTRRGIVRGTILLTLFAIAFLNYYYWTVNLEIASMPSVLVFGVKAPTAP